ncbi:thiamine phosphate synthase [Actibacterium sp. 188UL27-1]|uniref:thiamine phosphate synthase n=1 Tax=Actibacterium sp. 188UL27-1 TaxID=2786961 RepID=UPI00195901D8|nr:thiamine phosphate synthase [Actibacterium sp. 188UL27-1]MBM7068549.1 thiamine phosphate synthase [Actibacterium sp. 188UL27-1]
MRALPDLSTYLVLDPDLCAPIGMVETTRLSVAGGATIVQLRHKTATTAQRIALGQHLKNMIAGRAALCVNDDIEAAMTLQADILHIGQDDIAPAEARAQIGADMVLGLSVHSGETAQAVDPAIVDYVGVGPVFATQTKSDAKAPIGLNGLADIIGTAPVPAVAIGGVKTEHAAACIQAGAAGIAVVSAICGRPDPRAATANLVDTIRKARP